MNFKKTIAITLKELRSNFLVIGSFLIGVLVITLFFSNSNSLDFVENKAMIDTNYAFLLGVFMYMLIFGSLMSSEKIEEKHKGYSFLKLLPVRMSEIIAGKYLAIFINAAAGLLYLTVLNQFIYSYYKDSGFAQGYIFIAFSIAIVLVGLVYIFAAGRNYSSYLAIVIVLYILAMLTPQITSFVLLISGKEQQYFKMVEQVSKGGFPVHLIISIITFWICAYWAIRIKKKKQ